MALTPSLRRAAIGFGRSDMAVSEALAAIAEHAKRYGNLLTFADAVELARLCEYPDGPPSDPSPQGVRQ
jgi:hypothetical protein